MKSRLVIYTYDCKKRIEIGLPDEKEALMITIEELDSGGKFCISDIDAGAIPEIIEYLQRAEAEFFKKQSRLRGVW